MFYAEYMLERYVHFISLLFFQCPDNILHYIRRAPTRDSVHNSAAP